MSTPTQRIEVFQDTMDWIKNDPTLSASIPVAKKNTTVFYEDDYPAFDSSKTRDMIVSVSGDRSYQAAMRLHKENPEAKIAVMNFANAFHAGGGVTKGSSAQEECLCRTSTLYPLLYRRTLRDSFYKHHNDLNTPKATDSLVYTEGVIICKTDEDLPKRMPQEDWVTVDVITIAAPDLRDKSNIHAPLNDGDAVITPAFNMKNAKAIIHAVGPNFGVTPTAFEELFKAYYNSLLVLKENGYHSISFPLVSSSIFGGNLENPVAESTKQCVRAYKKFVED